MYSQAWDGQKQFHGDAGDEMGEGRNKRQVIILFVIVKYINLQPTPLLLKKTAPSFLSEFPFDFVFLIPLRNVDENCSLAKLIADEHDLEKEDIELVESILTRKTNHRVLLLIDGYDEYTPGTNTELDRAIENTVGKCLLILTSRPKDQKDFTIKIREKMAGEVEIQGFSEENIKKCCSKYLAVKKKLTSF